ncbi:hypothetical protein LEP1GSC061_3613 [Leptospira wolffii serovar Khorat str. Khorat-H2]|nr:hypothetical protein LEP1GSC061_3613 [Leptospira wolffii serovar Khorat str. Khorat-H2]
MKILGKSSVLMLFMIRLCDASFYMKQISAIIPAFMPLPIGRHYREARADSF